MFLCVKHFYLILRHKKNGQLLNDDRFILTQTIKLLKAYFKLFSNATASAAPENSAYLMAV